MKNDKKSLRGSDFLPQRLGFQSLILIVSFLATQATLANPVLEGVAAGDVTVTQTPGQTQVNQTSQQAIIDWQSFNINAGESTHFQQPVNGVALNRINPNQGASQIYGQLSSTGKIILVNQAGIYFGPGSRVDVGGIIASTSGISSANFLAGKYVFDQVGSISGSIINKGTIIAAQHGLVALMGSNVSNEGMIHAKLGNVVLASGSKFTVDMYGDQLINFAVDSEATGAASVKNSGTVIADGGTIFLSAKVAERVIDDVINMSGILQANSVGEENGEIILAGSDGDVKVSGNIVASGVTGGVVTVTGKNIVVASGAKVDVRGEKGGGDIYVGGNFKGIGPLQRALTTTIASGAELLADATVLGTGGNVAVWSDTATNFQGLITAKGGMLGGDGGFVETSGGYLNVEGGAVNTLANKGQTGMWLLDPTNIYIANSIGGNGSANNISGGIAQASGGVTDSWVTTGNLTAALNTSNVTVTTTNPNGAGNGDIFVIDPITWASTNTLTLSATRHIFLNNAISDSVSGGGLVLRADNTGTGIGTISGAGAINLPGGTIKAYYNPGSFNVPDLVLNITSGTLTPFILVNNETNLQAMTTALVGGNYLNYALGQSLSLISDFAPIGSLASPFLGSFDGLTNTLTNLSITSNAENVGLFASIGNGAYTGSIANLGFINPTISSTLTSGGVSVGTLAGRIESSATNNVVVNNVYISGGSVNSVLDNNNTTGGLVGFLNRGTISNSHNGISVAGDGASVTSSGGSDVGGVIGFASNARFINTFNTGNITGSSSSVGGIVGSATGTAISNSYNLGAIQVTYLFSRMGGIVGLIGDGSITSSYNTGNVSTALSNADAGGIAGDVYGTVVISNVYNTGNITAPSPAGIVSLMQNTSSISNAYNTGIITSIAGGSAAGLVHTMRNSASLTNSYNTGNVSAASSAGGLVVAIGDLVSITNAYNSGNLIAGDNAFAGGITALADGSGGGTKISNVYNTGSVTGGTNTYVGGVFGHFFNAASNTVLSNTYSTGAVTGGTPSLLGGFGGGMGGTTVGMINNYWDTQASGLATTQGNAIGMTTLQLQSGLPAGFSNTTWGITPGASYPYLLIFAPAPPPPPPAPAPTPVTPEPTINNAAIQQAIINTTVVPGITAATTSTNAANSNPASSSSTSNSSSSSSNSTSSGSDSSDDVTVSSPETAAVSLPAAQVSTNLQDLMSTQQNVDTEVQSERSINLNCGG